MVNGSPEGRILYRWVEADDRFEAGETSLHIATDKALVQRRAVALQQLADKGMTSAADLARLVAEHGAKG